MMDTCKVQAAVDVELAGCRCFAACRTGYAACAWRRCSHCHAAAVHDGEAAIAVATVVAASGSDVGGGAVRASDGVGAAGGWWRWVQQWCSRWQWTPVAVAP